MLGPAPLLQGERTLQTVSTLECSDKHLWVFLCFVGHRSSSHQRTLVTQEGKVRSSPNFTPVTATGLLPGAELTFWPLETASCRQGLCSQ